MKFKIVVIILLVGIVSGCSVYDSKRGIFVSSTVQNIKLNGISGKHIQLQNFNSPGKSRGTTQNNTVAIGGAFIPIGHTYVFDEVDRNNLRQSIITSFNNSGGILTNVKKPSTTSINVLFHELGMADGSLGSTLCIIVADMITTKGSNKVSQKVQIRANGGTVAGAKNNAIKQLTFAISSAITKNG